MTDKTPPIEMPTAAELNAAGVSCGTCDKRDLYDNDEQEFCMWLQMYIPNNGQDFFCAGHPKLRGEG